jgi:predicted transposase YbfD/YdcC
MTTNLHQVFTALPDPRHNRNKKHALIDIVILSIVAILSGAESWDSIELFGKTNIAFLKQFLSLKNGIPSHDTINRVFSIINPKAFEQLFAQWAQEIKDKGIIEKVVAIDGKTMRRTKDTLHHQDPVHLVSAWAVNNGICLAQCKTGIRDNEIGTIPKVLQLLDIKGTIITIDAIGTQKTIVKQIRKAQADYILPVKANQKDLLKNVHYLCETQSAISTKTTQDKEHGRIETRVCEVFPKTKTVDYLGAWTDLKSIVRITATRQFLNGNTTHQIRHYISSLPEDSDFNKYIRDHWAVENNLHWTLDMTFREDEQRKRTKYAAQNFAIVNKIALNLLKKDPGKESLKSKKLKAAWNKDYLLELLKIYMR